MAYQPGDNPKSVTASPEEADAAVQPEMQPEALLEDMQRDVNELRDSEDEALAEQLEEAISQAEAATTEQEDAVEPESSDEDHELLVSGLEQMLSAAASSAQHAPQPVAEPAPTPTPPPAPAPAPAPEPVAEPADEATEKAEDDEASAVAASDTDALADSVDVEEQPPAPDDIDEPAPEPEDTTDAPQATNIADLDEELAQRAAAKITDDGLDPVLDDDALPEPVATEPLTEPAAETAPEPVTPDAAPETTGAMPAANAVPEPAPAPAAEPAAEEAVATEQKPAAPPWQQRALKIAHTTLAVMSKPLMLVPPTVRDYLGWFAIVTAFNALCFWLFVLFGGG
ncbi:MAG: hypothetical protein AAFX05_02940 [Planctomycetota bacterium]